MKCRKCGQPYTRVTNSRLNDEGTERERRHQCEVCGHRWSTVEIPKDRIRRQKKHETS